MDDEDFKQELQDYLEKDEETTDDLFTHLVNCNVTNSNSAMYHDSSNVAVGQGQVNQMPNYSRKLHQLPKKN